jgi:hypothetical protein
MFKRLSFLVSFAVLASVALAQGEPGLTLVERKGLEDTLFLGNLNFEDLNYSRRIFNDPRLLPAVALAIDRPVDALEGLMGDHQTAAKASPQRVLANALGAIGVKPVAPTLTVINPIFPAGMPKELQGVVTRLVSALVTANQAVRRGQKDLKPAEIRQLVEGLPQWAVEEPSVKFEFVKNPMLPQADLLKLVERVDLAEMGSAATTLSDAVAKERDELERLSKTLKWEGALKFTVADQVVVIAGVGDDTHRDRDARLVIDLGGNDRYYGRAGAGPGYAALSIDVAGDDHYKLPDVGAGCGLVGVGIAYDLGGFDNFRGQSLSFGAGLAGVGMFVKAGGDDSYQTETLTQGFGLFGAGILFDSRGKDLYIANLFAQGAGRTKGIGWLVDQSGDDTYRAGGLIVNSPLFTDVHYSFAQGFGSGYREDTGGLPGGIGMLTDGLGDDAYVAETYAQAASYWYSLGSLGDLAGKDTYRGYHYCQSSAMHATAAYLLDFSGDDSYIDNFGAAHAIGHDYGVAVLFDRAGNDVYAGRDSRPGIGNANGLGLFMDVEGEDRYSGPPGVGNPGRGTGSLGIFLDLSGPDQYRDGLADEEAEVRNTWGVAYDQETKKTDAGATVDPAQTDTPPTPGSIPNPGDAKLAEIYKKASEWGVGSAQDSVKQNVNQLIGIGIPALQWMIANRLPNANRLQLRAFQAVTGALGSDGKLLIAMRIDSENVNEARNAIQISADLSATEAGAYLPKALGRPELVRAAARAAGLCQSRDSVKLLADLVMSKEPLVALPAMISLTQIGEPDALGNAALLLRSPSLPIRKAAVCYMAKVKGGYDQATAMLLEQDERSVRTAMEVLGAVASAEALKLIAQKLGDERPGVRISALTLLAGRTPAEFRQTVLDRRRDPDPRVRAVAARIDPGR